MTENSHTPTPATGLTDAQVAEQRRLYGDNRLTPPAKEPIWKQILAKFNDPLIIILMVAGVLSLLISFYEFYGLDQEADVFFEPVGIFLAIMLATGFSFYFEHKAGREFELLNQVNDDEPVQVIRNGRFSQIPRHEVVKGDLVMLNTGEEIPADGELLEAVSLNVDESTLTGEPMCHKTVVEAEFDPEATFASNVVMRGTKVMEGHGKMQVTAVGDSTENGKVFTAAQISDNVKTPLDEQFERLGSLISRVSYLFAVLIVVGRVTLYLINTPAGGFDWVPFMSHLLQSLMIAVTLVVVSVPEGLPMAVTLALAYSMRRMLRTNNLVRKMHACETMGATTVICTDKTGTLTQNKMQVAEMNFYHNIPDALFHQGLAVNSTAQLEDDGHGKLRALGNPTEGALLLWLNSLGVDYETLRTEAKRIEELPFTTERKYMATVVAGADGKRLLYVKGAPEIVAAMCGVMPEGVSRDNLNSTLLRYQNQAMRTLGFAFAELPADAPLPIADGKLQPMPGLTLVGVAAIADPVRTDVPDAVAEVLNAGIKVKIVTGDTPATAKEIGRRIGLWDDTTDSDANITTGADIAAMNDVELQQRIGEIKIIARARPMDKKRLVEALQTNGEVVAVTGDGTNDAPALKAAHVGLSMGDGTSVAKEASDITIVDNSFTSIGRAVMWGRSLYRNIQRFILFQMTVNVVASIIVLTGAFMGMQSPLTVTQMLWVNLIMDTFAAIALASLPPSDDVMLDKPRPRTAFIITPAMWRSILSVGGIFVALLLALVYYFEHASITSLTELGRVALSNVNSGLSPYELSLFFTIFVMLQFWNMFNAKAFGGGRSALHFRGCGEFVMIALGILLGQIAIITIGGKFFSVVPLRLTDWAIIISSTSLVLIAGEVRRLFTRGHTR